MSQIDNLKRCLADLPAKNKAAQLRPLMPTIDERVREGVQHQAIIDELRKHGIDLNLNTFRSCLYRYRARQRRGQPAPPPPAADGNPGSAQDDEETSPSDAGQSQHERFSEPRTSGSVADKYIGLKRPIRGLKQGDNE